MTGPQGGTPNGVDRLARVEAETIEEIGVCRYNKDGSPYLPKERAKENVLALVEIARTMEKIANYDFEYADEYAHEMRDIARSALTRLDESNRSKGTT